MAKNSKSGDVGYRKPPRNTQFKPGKSGNPSGRPKGAKSFATVLAKELDDRVPVTENGKRKKISKRQAIAKQVVNRAASGDLKAAQTIFTQDRLQENSTGGNGVLDVFDTPEHHLVMANIIRRIRSMDEQSGSDAESNFEIPPPKPPSKSKRKDNS